jgi:hypothetical protein
VDALDPLHGLSEEEAIERRSRGQGNDIRLSTSRSYLQILRQNVFTFTNIVLFAIGITLILLGQAGDAQTQFHPHPPHRGHPDPGDRGLGAVRRAPAQRRWGDGPLCTACSLDDLSERSRSI